MLQQALTNIRAAIVLRECAVRAPSAAERRFFTAFAQLYEARARRFISAYRG